MDSTQDGEGPYSCDLSWMLSANFPELFATQNLSLLTALENDIISSAYWQEQDGEDLSAYHSSWMFLTKFPNTFYTYTNFGNNGNTIKWIQS